MTTATTKAPKQVAVNDIGSADDFMAAVEKTLKFFNDGDLIEGTVVKIDRDEVLLDVGYKTEGVIPSRELSIKHDVDPTEVVEVGDAVEALVLQKEDKEGRLILSKKRAQYERAWGDVEKIKETDGVVTGSVIEVVKGGLIVDIGLRGFLPASLIELRRVRDLTPYLGQEIEAKILELDKNRNNVVLSRRALLEETQSASRTQFLDGLQKGQIRKGVVSSIVNFGAFVDLGGVDGLVHVSELSWKHIEHASEVVEVGQEVTVEVLTVERDRERVSLSLKATQEDPWQVFARTHAIGQVAPGKVTKLVTFGAFVRVADGIEGLVHISELSDKHVETADQVVSVNDEVFVKIIDIDLERRRISLSLKQANFDVDPDATEFDPALYGMLAEYDEQGNYKFPEGFDPETNEWREGFDAQREAWEAEYAAAQARWEAHKEQVRASREAEAADVAAGVSTGSSYSSESNGGGTLADDEALAALREKLTGRAD
ncbi:30S ribosomal protein S1 [Agrococcus sp. SGAir0287]|uniref:30S ribosomal protein S1 n=1 Tax=Agrococcus sp. SGAir0287 TaxID=2070347 RepID=UPI0010CCE25E|nr:30S ribosomal protein S1 [Agrococcus sp. SGAir0287]QCR19284.1 30S ribosomal protein S1 [Agrococcus sp. SGAir0287]